MRRRAAPATPPVEKLPFLEGLRGLAALYVVLGHLCSMADPSRLAGRPSQAPVWLLQLMAPFAYGHLAVAAFIVISGFCLQLSLYANGTGKVVSLVGYAKRRAKRILPPYYACLGMSMIVTYFVTERFAGQMPFDQYLPVTSAAVWTHVFLVHNLSLDWMYKINGVLWSIAIEAQLYFVFPALVRLIARFGRMTTLWGTLFATLLLLLLPNAPKLYPWYLFLFTAGMVSAHFAYRPNLRSGQFPIPVAALGWLFVLLGARAIWADSSLALTDSLFGLGIACFIHAWTVRPRFFLAKRLSWKPLVRLGAFSYSLYLMHHPIEQTLYAIRPTFVQGEAPVLAYLFFLGLPVILGLTYVFSALFEQPFVSRRRPARETMVLKPLIPAALPLRVYEPSRGRSMHAVVDAPRRATASRK